MTTSSVQFKSLETLIRSEGGVHFSAYVSDHPGAPSARAQIEEVLKVASEDTRLALTRQERIHFLKPVRALLEEDSLLSAMTGSFAIFRSKQFFRVLRLPFEVEEYSTVATSFHVKPLLKWIQEDRDFLLLLVGGRNAWLHSGTQFSLRPLGSFKIPGGKGFRFGNAPTWMVRAKSSRASSVGWRKLLSWVEERLALLPSTSRAPLYLAGEGPLCCFLENKLSYPRIHLVEEDQPWNLGAVLDSIRREVQLEVEQTMSAHLTEFKYAEATDRAETNLKQIARAAREGRVRKLMVAADRKIFGTFASSSGALDLRAVDIDHEDEDVLDDLAQAVIKSGGDVVVAPLNRIPGKSPALAISEPEGLGESRVFAPRTALRR